MLDNVRYLLLQVRNDDDPMAGHEVDCFARALNCPPEQISEFDLIAGSPSDAELDAVDIVLLGGSGDYCVSKGGAWLDPALDTMRQLHATSKPTFASCWGFQAMAQALGGHVIADASRAEVGTHEVFLTTEGRADPLFGALAEAGDHFPAQMGHEDVVDRLPPDAVLLAKTRLSNQAFYFPGKPIYCTQFHPELDRETLLDRLRKYPTYIERITGIPYDQFVQNNTGESVHTDALLARFVALVMTR
ncbi:MAG: type 1 glutamine amidotransferase [Planctomycetota bacterium]|nr:MAG: type 1 glutamine amidotransferase [Planctomycetota bacterium]